MIQAVIFDLDGVLADSMPQHAASFQDVLGPLGVPAPQRRVFELEGARSKAVIQQLFQDAGRTLDDDEAARLADEKQQAFRARGIPRLFPMAEGLLAAATGLSTALVTGTRKENLDRMLGHLSSRFDALLAEDAYERGKPDPEPYLNACAQLGLAPSACLAVENAPFGVQSAKAAGCTVWAVTTTLGRDDLRQADQVFDDHEQVRDGIARLAARRLQAASEEPSGGTLVEP